MDQTTDKDIESARLIIAELGQKSEVQRFLAACGANVVSMLLDDEDPEMEFEIRGIVFGFRFKGEV